MDNVEVGDHDESKYQYLVIIQFLAVTKIQVVFENYKNIYCSSIFKVYSNKDFSLLFMFSNTVEVKVENSISMADVVPQKKTVV